MRDIKTLLKLAPEEWTEAETKYVEKYRQLKKYRHSNEFIRHSQELPEEPPSE